MPLSSFVISDQLKTIICAYVTSKLDFSYSLLAGIPHKSLNKIQQIQNAAARLISGSKKHEHITSILEELHWLPINYCIHYKIMVLVHKVLEGSGTAYLQELLKTYKPNRSLQSSGDPSLLVVRRLGSSRLEIGVFMLLLICSGIVFRRTFVAVNPCFLLNHV